MKSKTNLLFSVLGAFSRMSSDAITKPQGGEIYRIWFDNDPSGKCYVGQTVQGSLNRIRQHIEDAQNYYKGQDGGCPLLDAATRKYGVSHMQYEILEQGISTHEELDQAEIYWISRFNCRQPNGYNVKKGGQGGYLSPYTSMKKVVNKTIGKRHPIIAAFADSIIEGNEYRKSPTSMFMKQLFK